ncbi:MAG: hypothetical protein ACRCUP_07430 [Mycoplasmatales bacterium]
MDSKNKTNSVAEVISNNKEFFLAEMLKKCHAPEKLLEIIEFCEKKFESDYQVFRYNELYMIGFVLRDYHSNAYSGAYPRVAIIPQSNYIGLYITAFKDGESVVSKYTHHFPKSSVKKSCIHLKKITAEQWSDLEGLLTFVKEQNNEKN